MKPGDGFTALICLIVILVSENLAAVPVPPPTDVNVTCRNLEVQVRLNYSRAHANSRFNITLKARSYSLPVGHSTVELERSTVEHHYDLTPLIWSSEDMYMSNFHVVVTATLGGNHSQPAKSDTFTFNIVETAIMTCKLEFPPLELVRTDVLDATLAFRNPFHFYRELQQAQKHPKAYLSVTVTYQDVKTDFSCGVKEETCKHEVVFPEGGKDLCVTLDGLLFAGDEIGQISFKRSERICAADVSDPLWMLVYILPALAALAAILTVAIIVAKRISSNASTLLPSATQWPVFRKLALLYASVPPEDTCIVHTAPRTAEASLSSNSSCLESRASVCCEDQSSHQEWAHVGGSSEGGDQDQDQDQEHSGYEHRHFLVDMGDGDMVTVYKD